jgi:hypothetical protein
MRFLRSTLFVLALAAAGGTAVGCATSGATSSAPRGSSDVITQAELARVEAVTLRQAIERLRPNFLRSRGPSSITDQTAGAIIVYLDETRMGGLDALENIPVTEVREVRKLNASEATQRYGTGHAGGVIVVRRKT